MIGTYIVTAIIRLRGMLYDTGIPNMGGSQLLYFIECLGCKVCHFTASVFRYVPVIDAVIMIVTKQARKHLIDNHFFIFPHSIFYFMI